MPRRDDELEFRREKERRPRREEEDRPRKKAASQKSSSALVWILVLGGVGALGLCLACGGVGAYFLLRAKDGDRMVRSSNNLRQIGLATHSCHDAYGELPLLSGVWKAEPPGNNPPQRTLFFWLLPYVESDNLFKNNLHRGPGATTDVLVRVYVDPEDTTGDGVMGECSYAGNWQTFQAQTRVTLPITGTVPTYAKIPQSFPDGLSNTVFFAEHYQNCNGTIHKWAQTGATNEQRTPVFNRQTNKTNVVNDQLPLPQFGPKPQECKVGMTQSPYTSGMPVGVGDGSVRVISPKTSLTTWQRICCPADGQGVSSDW